jgi:hypothetical protein
VRERRHFDHIDSPRTTRTSYSSFLYSLDSSFPEDLHNRLPLVPILCCSFGGLALRPPPIENPSCPAIAGLPSCLELGTIS